MEYRVVIMLTDGQEINLPWEIGPLSAAKSEHAKIVSRSQDGPIVLELVEGRHNMTIYPRGIAAVWYETKME